MGGFITILLLTLLYTVIDLHPPHCHEAIATDINDYQEVCGMCRKAAHHHWFLFRWSPDQGHQTHSCILQHQHPQINNSGQIAALHRHTVWLNEMSHYETYCLLRWDRSHLFSLGTPRQTFDIRPLFLKRINDHGQILLNTPNKSWLYTDNYFKRLRSPHLIIDINKQGDLLSSVPMGYTPLKINNKGEVLARQGKNTLLIGMETLTIPHLTPIDFNDNGQILGLLDDIPILYDKGSLIDLTTYAPTLTTPTALNNRGDIVGNALLLIRKSEGSEGDL
ncbi:MAG: hypothetical protein KDK65_04080 [Chlamydiia bacterium]|nr:hypothetical protein [Chlamydiia bacterium]